jgi:tRNA pseudouridine38-40 synthase
VRSRLLCEYDGRGFAGWARQSGARTIQAELERALAVVLRRASVALSVAGRTDAGVHAWGQVASYAGPPARVNGVNALLPADVAVLSCVAAGPDFDARHDATSRAYCYRVLARRSRSALEAGRSLHWPHSVDLSLLEACAAALIGTHDFTAFTPTETHHVRFEREVYAAGWRAGDRGAGSAGGGGGGSAGGGAGSPGGGRVAPGEEQLGLLEFWIEADAFMRQMNRVLVGTMLEVAAGRRSLTDFGALLRGAPRARAGVTAPAHGLYLAGVGYNGQRVLSDT